MKPFIYKHPHKYVDLYPLGDFHWGSHNCNEDFIRQVIAEIKSDEQARVVLMGDLIENAIVGSKGDVYKQVMAPQKQIEEIIEILQPIRDKILFAITGNHEERSFSSTGIDPTQVIAYGVGVPSKGYSCLCRIQLESRTPKSFLCFFHHNWGGGYTQGGKVNRAVKLRDILPHADATFTAHMHTTARVPHTWYDLTRSEVVERVGYDYITGSALTYNESYADARAKSPATCEFICVRMVGATTGKRDNRKQIYRVITPE